MSDIYALDSYKLNAFIMQFAALNEENVQGYYTKLV